MVRWLKSPTLAFTEGWGYEMTTCGRTRKYKQKFTFTYPVSDDLELQDRSVGKMRKPTS